MLETSPEAQEVMQKTMSYRSELMFGQNASRRNIGIFLNNRCLVTAVKARVNDSLLSTIGQELIEIHQRYSHMTSLPAPEETDLKNESIFKDLLTSASLLVDGKLPFHDFQKLPGIQEQLASMRINDLRIIFQDGAALTPLLNIADLMFQMGDSDLMSMGLQYLNIANTVAKTLTLPGVKARAKSLYGAYFLDIGQPKPAESLLTDMSEVTNQYDYTKFLNQVLLSMAMKSQGDLATAARIDQRAAHIKEVLAVSDHAEEIGWLIFPDKLILDSDC